MTDLERRALLGDVEAQRDCTEKGIALPCPKCGSKWTQVRHMGWPGPSAFRSGYRGECTDCHMITEAHKTEKEALADWNTRPAPPIGRCKDCAYRKPWGECNNTGEIKSPNGFCDAFCPKGGEENADL